MLLYHLKLALRTLKRQVFVSTLNIVGLAIGLAAFLILAFYIENEASFDRFHIDYEKIYRVESGFLPSESKNDMLATSSFGYGPAMKIEMPEVQDFCRIMLYRHEKDVKYNNKVFREEFVVPVDSNFFTFFSFPLVEGDPKTVLNQPFTMAISESAAKKYFSHEEPMGKVLEIKTPNNTIKYTVKGVFKDFPETSHFKSNFLLSYPYGNKRASSTWYMHEAYTYVKVNSEKEKLAIEAKFPEMAESYKTAEALRDKQWVVDLVPLEDIHLNQIKAYELESKGNRKSIYLLSVIAIIIIAIAWINYINISTTYALERSGEISVRKINGAQFREIVRQFLAEAVFVNTIALTVSLLLIIVLLPVVENLLLAKDLSDIWSSKILWVGALAALFLGIILTGYAPALLLSKVKSSNVLRNKSNIRVGNKRLREGLVIVQFVTSIILIVGTLTVRKQILFMKNQNLGVDIQKTMVFKAPTNTNNYYEKIETLNREIEKVAGVNGVCGSSVVPGKAVGHLLSNRRVDQESDKNKLCEMLRVDYDYIPLYGLEILAGRNFSEQRVNDVDGLILTETAAKMFGLFDYEKAINKEILLEGVGKRFHVIGILKDYHHISLKDTYRPIMLFMAREHGWIRINYYSVKVDAKSVFASMGEIEKLYRKAFPDTSFEYFFLDKFFNNQYQGEVKFGRIFMVFTWLAIFIVCLGIIGLSGYILLKRTKEIGVRKVNGASITGIVTLVSKDFIIWNVYALLIGGPIAYFLMSKWLENFAYKTGLSWWIFLAAGVGVVVIALLTVSVQSLKAATRNPVEALRYE